MLNTTSPIAKTAFDAVQAKRSVMKVGYRPLVVVEEEVYKDLLDSITSDFGRVKRQIPLINAGYVIRMLAMSHAIHNYVSYNLKYKQIEKINLVFLGCGIDIIGLWAGLLDPMRHRIQIIEVDTKEVCSAKREMLVRKDMIQPISTKEDFDDVGILRGRIRDRSMDDNSSIRNNKKITTEGGFPPSNYSLIPADLRDISKIDSILSHTDQNVPTMVIFELVLTYLLPTETDTLLRWCATNLCRVPGSVITALEPLGPSPLASAKAFDSMEYENEGYKKEYCGQFEAKLGRGKALESKSFSLDCSYLESVASSFHPLGFSSDDVARRLIQAGFETAHGACLGNVAVETLAVNGEPGLMTLESPEIFDEHAALSLHLKSYTLVCGFSKGTENVVRRMVCPWYFSSRKMGEPRTKGIMLDAEMTIFTVIECTDEIPVRTMFLKAYEHLFDEYPPVRRMCKTALKTDLAIETKSEKEKISNQGDSSIQSIESRYKALGGIFLVAIQYRQKKRHVVGCVGVRSCYQGRDIGQEFAAGETKNTLEIFRLIVDPANRRQGIGTSMLRHVENFASSHGSPEIMATTLAVLEPANRLYEKCGYKVHDQIKIGSTVMRTYMKRL